jgi:hypothetical protein
MSFLDRLKLTYLDKDGSWAVPEVVATIAACNCIVCPLVDWIRGAASYPIVAVTSSLSGIVLALAAAQRVRDGLWKAGDTPTH